MKTGVCGAFGLYAWWKDFQRRGFPTKVRTKNGKVSNTSEYVLLDTIDTYADYFRYCQANGYWPSGQAHFGRFMTPLIVAKPRLTVRDGKNVSRQWTYLLKISPETTHETTLDPLADI